MGLAQAAFPAIGENTVIQARIPEQINPATQKRVKEPPIVEKAKNFQAMNSSQTREPEFAIRIIITGSFKENLPNKK